MGPTSQAATSGPARFSMALYLALALALVSVTTFLVWRKECAVREANRLLYESAVPSMVQLSRVRQGVQRVFRELALEGPTDLGPRREEVRRRFEAGALLLDSRLDEYERLPPYAGERALQGRLRWLVAEVRAAERELLEAPDEAAAREVLLRRLAPAVSDVSQLIDEMIIGNAVTATESARVAEDVRGITRATFGVLTLGALASLALLARAVRRADRRVAQSLEELDAFSARVAHDLKSPLQSARLGLSLLRRGDLAEREVGRALDLLERSLRRQEGMVDGLLALAHAGARPAPGARATVGEALVELMPALEPLAAQERAELVVDVAGRVPVAAGHVALCSILDNLLRNAVLYLGTSERRVVTVRARAEGERAVIEVADTGPGIPRDTLLRLFRPFQRASGRPGGAGLGLATVKRLVEAHGGQVSVRSQVGAGSVFRVELPLPREDQGVSRARSSQKVG